MTLLDGGAGLDRELDSLPAALRAGCEARPRAGISLFDRRGRQVARHPWRDVLAAAEEAAGRLAARGLGPGDRVLVALPTSLAWFEAWVGSLLLGALPVAMTSQAGADAGTLPRRRLDAVITRLEPGLVVAGRALVDALAGHESNTPACTPEELAATTAAAWGAPGCTASETAFLQLTSGSTGVPRAVEISHGAAVHNALALDLAVGAPFGVRSRERVDGWVSWVPLHHDMGLNSTLSLMLCGLDLWLCPPQAFLGRPRVWLEQLGSRGVTVATAPNFGYQLCVERLGPADMEGIDLSSWCTAFSAAEMVRHDTIEAFVETFSPYGFRREALRPGYGLAEATVIVTADQAGRGPRTLALPEVAGPGPAQVVSTGTPVVDTRLRIVRPDGTAAAERQVGEVLVQGPGLFSGYFRDPAASAEALVDGWLRTGDLGFLDAGELFIVGRSKDVLIVRGQNIMPHELEWLAEGVSGGGGSTRAAAFTVTRGPQGEEIVLALEVSDRDGEALAGIAQQVRSRIGRELGLPLADAVLVRRGRIPRTTSGKVRRDELRRLYLDGRLERLDA